MKAEDKVEPHQITNPGASGHLDRSGHHIAWWESGNPDGLPVVILHGGPGAGSAPGHRAPFNPKNWRIVQFDQRGCGESTPQAELRDNTTSHLLDDMEALRTAMGIDAWVVHGGSWGTTLGLTYGERYPDRVRGFLLRAIFHCRDEDVRWTFERGGASLLRPDAFEQYVDASDVKGNESMVAAYARKLLQDVAPEDVLAAARAWAEWEHILCYLMPQSESEPLPDKYVLELARLENHYLSQRGFLAENEILDQLSGVSHLPAILIHGRYDLCRPVAQAWALHQAWPKSDLRILPDASHASTEPPIVRALTQAAHDLYQLLS